MFFIHCFFLYSHAEKRKEDIMETFLTSVGSVVTSIGTQFADVSTELIANNVVQLAVGMIIFGYLIRKTKSLINLAHGA